jgi:renalase
MVVLNMVHNAQPAARTAVPQVAIIGAGLAGLMAARQLAAHGASVTVFEKSRAPGGRAATRRHGAWHFDHGAQYFTHRDPRLAGVIAGLSQAGVVAPWTGRVVAITGTRVSAVSDATTRWVAVPGMRSMGEHLARGVDVRHATTVRRLVRDGARWHLYADGDTSLGAFDQLLVTAPAPQAHALLATHAPVFAASLARVVMHPCLALMVVLPTRPPVPWDAAFVNDDPVLSWVARNASKPGRGAHECWVAHATAAWSTRHLEEEPVALVPDLLAALGRVFGAPIEPAHAVAHRWRFAQPEPCPSDALGEAWFDAALGLGVGGDWCVGGRVEGALTSGMVLGDLAWQGHQAEEG